MIFETHIPSLPLSKYIASIVYYDGYNPNHTFEKLLPDGSVYLLIDFKDIPKKCCHSDDFSDFETFTSSYISGQHKKYIYIEATQDSSMMVVQFKFGGTAPFFDCKISELNETVRQSEYYFGDALDNLRTEMLQESIVHAKISKMERFLLDRMNETLESNPILTALQLLETNPFEVTTKKLALAAGISQKHLISLFDKYVGLTPKTLARIYRFQQVLKQIEVKKDIDWLQLLADCGYYDQSHFVKDFHDFSGINPTQYLDEKGEYLNYIPVKQG